MNYKNYSSFMPVNTMELPKGKIIPFPGVNLEHNILKFQSSCHACNETHPQPLTIIPGKPGDTLPEAIPDFRPFLQRDGLILLSWDVKKDIYGNRYTAYWVTSTGVLRYYASPAVLIEDFMETMPDHKSYAAEDGIDYYGDKSPDYMVYVAPELMMSSRTKKIQRPVHIKVLKVLGSQVDFDYSFNLTKEKKKKKFILGEKKSVQSFQNRLA